MKEKEEEKIDLVPAEEPPLMRVMERDARNIMNELFDICSICQSASNLPPTANINRSANFYLEEVMRTLKEYNIIEM